MIKTVALTFSAMAMLAVTPVMAQDASEAQPGDEKINQLIIFDDEECPASTADVINVCAIVVSADRYRIPKELRSDPNDRSKEAWSQRVKAYEYVAATGIGSCSTAGAGGFTGCGISEINAAYAEKAEDPGLVFGRLIAAARRERLAGIDAEAQEIEDVVLAEERAAALKKLQEQGNSVEAGPNEEVDAGPLPQPE